MGADELRDFKLKPMKCELNFLSKSDGSAILSQGKYPVKPHKCPLFLR